MKTLKFLGIVLLALVTSVITSIYVIEKKYPKVEKTQGYITEPLQYVNYTGQQMVDLTNAAYKTIHAVVHVRTKTEVEYYNPFYDFFFGEANSTMKRPVLGYGSGVIVSSDGYIITNNHVIKDAENISVKLNDNREFDAKVVGTDPNTDLAVLKVDVNGLEFVEFGNSDELRLGEWVLAVGNPFNLTSTVTAGIISAKSRNLDILPGQYSIESFIQTDAALNHGNSGGALVNVEGLLVGINTAIMSPSGAYSGNSFAVPVSIVKKVYEDIKEFGAPQHPKLGISPVDVDATIAKEQNLDKVAGILIKDLSSEGAAQSAGMKKGDIIVKIQGKNVDNISQLQEQLNRFRPGNKINVDVLRNGKLMTFETELKNIQGTTSLMKSNPDGTSLFGATFRNLTPEEKSKYRLKSGVQLTETGTGKFKQAGIEKGFIVTRLNNKTVNNTDDLINIVNNSKGGMLIEGVYPNGMVAYYAFGL